MSDLGLRGDWEGGPGAGIDSVSARGAGWPILRRLGPLKRHV